MQVVDFITHSIEDGLYFTAFQDKTDFSLRYAAHVRCCADFCDFKTGDFEMIRNT